MIMCCREVASSRRPPISKVSWSVSDRSFFNPDLTGKIHKIHSSSMELNLYSTMYHVGR